MRKGCVSWRRYGSFPSTGIVEVCIVVSRLSDGESQSSDLRRPVSEALLHQHRNLENRPGVAKSVRKVHLIACPSLRALRIMMEQCSPKGVRMLKGQPDRRNLRGLQLGEVTEKLGKVTKFNRVRTFLTMLSF